jgi:hypothetical protein
LVWKVILQFANNLTWQISDLVSTFLAYCENFVENGGGMSMVNLDSYIDSGRIKFIYVLLMNQLKAIGKYWLSGLDLKLSETRFAL